jgi:signal transduction protein with GAF and PtsI domain
MDSKTLSSLHEIFQEVQGKQDWKDALDTLFVSLRGSFVFDNVAIYILDSHTQGLDVVYARAVGRGKTAEAESAWGERLASQVLARQNGLRTNSSDGRSGSSAHPYLLGFCYIC